MVGLINNDFICFTDFKKHVDQILYNGILDSTGGVAGTTARISLGSGGFCEWSFHVLPFVHVGSVPPMVQRNALGGLANWLV